MAFKSYPDGTMVVTGLKDTKLVRLMALKAALGLEIKGLKASRGRSAYATIKSEFNLRGNKASVLEQFTKILEQKRTERLKEPNE